MVLFEIIFWFSISLIIYSTIFYPVLLNFIRSNIYVVDEKFIPEVSLIISAYNEEKNILKKLRNIDDSDNSCSIFLWNWSYWTSRICNVYTCFSLSWLRWICSL